ncbi:polysaccharide deacetylase family protein [Olleya aquimaris]|uniref:Peptidoglycan/xylan/chitin deacetylase (PgdA/CDA1 family) n=1 Tax=Olleya aquimaris TaxID=639310 RepID=A0A327RX85_9FLAO|nr:polysaccharide deacetylase family protein [Olleya aquimaris]RAJ18197.1 peptidoglycan/xylan/chitin deacetylase (PgdA/CDA1 family) [Olleya aquimaris]
MLVFPVKTPRIIQRLFSKYTWKKASSSKTIYLTFDDGPTPEITQWTLDILKQYQAKATFFCIGHNIEKHPDIFNAIVNDQHTIGNHTFNHLKGWKTDTKTYIENTDKTQSLIDSKIKNPRSINKYLFRPPFGKIKRNQAKILIKKGYEIVMWTVISYDWEQKLSPEKCLKNVLKHTTPGSIVVFHDSIKASKNMQFVLPKVLEHFSQQGYQFKAL